MIWPCPFITSLRPMLASIPAFCTLSHKDIGRRWSRWLPQIALRSLCHQGTTSSQNLGKMSHSPVSFHRRGQYSKLHGKRSSPIRLTSWLAATCPKGKVMLQSTKDRYWATVVWAWQAPSSSCPTSWPLTRDSTAAASRPAQGTMELWKPSQWGWL